MLHHLDALPYVLGSKELLIGLEGANNFVSYIDGVPHIRLYQLEKERNRRKLVSFRRKTKFSSQTKSKE